MSAIARRAVTTCKVLRRNATTVAAGSQAGATSASASLPSLSNIEASWKTLSSPEQESVFKHLEELQKKDWKELTIDQKKAAYYVAFGPHGPREPILPPNGGIKIAVGTLAAIGTAFGIFALIRSQAPEPPKTLTKEWEEATAERMREQKANPFTGYASKSS